MRTLTLALLACCLAACGVPGPTTAPSPGASASPAPAAQGGPRPIVITTDMGMDDLLAIYLALRDPGLDVLAVTVDGTGLVHCGAGVRNLRRILTAFGRPDIPFGCGREDPGPDGVPFPDEWRASSDAMYGVVLPPVVATDFPPAGADVLRTAIEASDAPVTILALGPWTTLEDLFAASPSLAAATEVAGIHAMAGTIDAPGNMSTAAIHPEDGVEWNVGADPSSMAAVLALDIPVTLVPLDATDAVPVPGDITSRLEADHAAAGADIAYETYIRSPYLATPGNDWWDTTAVIGLVRPDLLAWTDGSLAISDRGRLTRVDGGRAVRWATDADTAGTQAAILEGLRRGAQRPVPFALDGTVRITWDGTRCAADTQAAPASAGLARLELANGGPGPVALFGAGAVAPRTWADVVAWARAVDLSATDVQPPDWIVELEGEGLSAGPGETALGTVTLPPGEVGFLCATGDWPTFEFVDAGSITLTP